MTAASGLGALALGRKGTLTVLPPMETRAGEPRRTILCIPPAGMVGRSENFLDGLVERLMPIGVNLLRGGWRVGWWHTFCILSMQLLCRATGQ